MEQTTSCVHFLAFVLLVFASSAYPFTYNVLSYGAKPDGNFESTRAFVAAWTLACGSIKSATIYIPTGRFLLRNVVFRGQCKNNAIVFRMDGTLVAPSDYKVLGSTENWLLFEHVNGVSIYGGVLDGQGTGLWTCKRVRQGLSQRSNGEFCVWLLVLVNESSASAPVVIDGCNNVKGDSVSVSASGNSPNTDGIHVQSSSSVTILNSRIGTGDDCVSVGPGTNNLCIENMACGPGHGISIGSLGKEAEEPGVQNVTVKTITLTGTQNGHAIMTDVENPIVIDQHYCPDEKNCPGLVSGVKISDVTYQDIHGTSATEVAVKFDCSPSYPCTDIRLEDVKLTYRNKPAEASCSNADGTVSGFIQPSCCL
ncbi:Polygalacturonase [Hibiscus syriacus]|uniref:Polygalacturonase n=1 Tax=Hibiscus syriacus TaxID=106335 RepID=A0A6A2XWQ6_HIBSY|nr:Polygalacturonase [Hibiscus syriacus]